MNPSFSIDDLARALTKALTTDGLLQVLADTLNELHQRGGEISFSDHGIDTHWADVSLYQGRFVAGYYAEPCAEDAMKSLTPATQLGKAKLLAGRLLEKERNHAGSGRDGHLNEGDLLPLLQELDA